MKIKDLEIQFRYLCGNIACMSVNSIDGKPVHNDINNDDAIKMFNALIGSKENSILEENKELKKRIDRAIKLLQENVAWGEDMNSQRAIEILKGSDK